MVTVAPALAADVDIWFADLGAGPAGVNASDDERQRAAGMRSVVERARFLASRAWLRLVLGACVGVDPAAVRFSVTDRGKPVLAGGGDLCFSLSRSADLALIAVTMGRAVGVDVERLRSDVDHESIAAHVFSSAEAGALRGLAEPDGRNGFFRMWTRKEAVVKASGAGLVDGISHIDVSGSRVADRWSVASLDVGEGFAAAVAVEGSLGPLSIRTLPAEEPGTDLVRG